MKKKELKIREKDYEKIKGLSNRKFGFLVKSMCEYILYGKEIRIKDKMLKLYFNMFKEKIQQENFYQETGRIGGIKSQEIQRRMGKGMTMILDILSLGNSLKTEEETKKDVETEETETEKAQ